MPAQNTQSKTFICKTRTIKSNEITYIKVRFIFLFTVMQPPATYVKSYMCPYMSYGFTSTVTNNTSKTYERLQESKKILQPIHSYTQSKHRTFHITQLVGTSHNRYTFQYIINHSSLSSLIIILRIQINSPRDNDCLSYIHNMKFHLYS